MNIKEVHKHFITFNQHFCWLNMPADFMCFFVSIIFTVVSTRWPIKVNAKKKILRIWDDWVETIFVTNFLNCSEEIHINYACKCQKTSKEDLGSSILDQNERKMLTNFCPNYLLTRGRIKRIKALDYNY